VPRKDTLRAVATVLLLAVNKDMEQLKEGMALRVVPIILLVKALVAMVASPKQVADTVAQATARLAMAVPPSSPTVETTERQQETTNEVSPKIFNSFFSSGLRSHIPFHRFFRLTMYALDSIPKAFLSLYSDINLFASRFTLSSGSTVAQTDCNHDDGFTNKSIRISSPSLQFSFIKTSGLQRSCIVRFPGPLPKKCLIDNRYPKCLLIRQSLASSCS
jgi:hypothetical protein